MNPKPVSFDEYRRLFAAGTDMDYLRAHYQRFIRTRQLAYQSWEHQEAVVLDIGAHWLHQAVLYRQDGHRVIAADLPATSSDPQVQALASAQGIDLLSYTDLDNEDAFSAIAENSVDVVLFCEIIEHITFNPLAMWKAVYRVLRPGGKIIITTPNFYYLPSLIRTLGRLIAGRGVGIDTADILQRNTHAPHWKEFSAGELRAYFALLSPDFHVSRLLTFNHHASFGPLNWKGELHYWVLNHVTISRQSIFLEVTLAAKEQGITVTTHW
jgi:2-polyprenyl-6-hydroxyphenyl methylase/3-demethylubiquinone-9 3-methyltransferase